MENEERYKNYPPVRGVTRKDRKKLSDLVKAFADKSGNSRLTGMIPSADKSSEGTEDNAAGATGEDKDEKAYELIKSVLEGLLQWVEEDVNAWFMDLIGVTDKEDYDGLPFDIEIYIIDRLMEQKGFNNFFTRASELYNKIRG